MREMSILYSMCQYESAYFHATRLEPYIRSQLVIMNVTMWLFCCSYQLTNFYFFNKHREQTFQGEHILSPKTAPLNHETNLFRLYWWLCFENVKSKKKKDMWWMAAFARCVICSVRPKYTHAIKLANDSF